MSNGPKYVLLPNDVYSATDGDKHFINTQKLTFLYKVSALECAVYDARRVETEGSHYHKLNKWKLEQLIPLEPDFYGKYVIPDQRLSAEDLKMYDHRAEWADEALRLHSQRREREQAKLNERTRLAVGLGITSSDPLNKVPHYWPFPVAHGKIPD